MTASDARAEMAFSTTPVAPGPAQLVDPNTFVFWIAAVATVYSAVQVFQQITAAPVLQVLPAVGWLAVVLWSTYAAVFVLVLTHHQLFVRRAPAVLAGAFLWGGATATYFAAKANAALQDLIVVWVGVDLDEKWVTALAAATNEEILKLLGVGVLFLLPRARLRGAIDGLYYGAILGLGFQVVEDFTYTVQQSADLAGVVGFVVVRGLLTGIFSHAAYTAVTGAGLGYCVSRRDRPWPVRIGVAVGAFVAVWVLHMLWDAPLIDDAFGDSFGGAIAIVLVKGVPLVAIVLAALHWARDAERRRWNGFVEEHVDHRVITPAEAAELQSYRSRRAAARRVRHDHGRVAAKAREELQTAQVRYVQAAREEGPASDSAVRWSERIAALRPAAWSHVPADSAI